MIRAILPSDPILSGLAEATLLGAGSTSPSPMNLLIVGSADKADVILRYLPESFLLIDDGKLIDALPKRHRKTTALDFSIHHFNPLQRMDYRRAREFLMLRNALFPEGANTLARKGSNLVLLKALTTKRERKTYIDRLLPAPAPREKDTGVLDAYQSMETMLLSPVLRRFMCKATNFSLRGRVLVRLDRSKLSDFDCRVIANLLISNYRGQVVVPDYGFYACDFHDSLIEQHRLIAGVKRLDQVGHLRDDLLLIEKKIAKHCTVEDAEVLAGFSGFPRGTDGYTGVVQQSVR